MSEVLWCGNSVRVKEKDIQEEDCEVFCIQVVSHFCFNLHSLRTYDVEHLFIYLYAVCMSSHGKVSVQDFCPLFNQIVNFHIVEF